MTETERARELADAAERDGYIDISETMPNEAEDMRIWIKGARLLAASGDAPSPDLMGAVADAIAGVEIVSRVNYWTKDRVEGFPIEVLDASGVAVSGDEKVISRHRAEEGVSECREAAERTARASVAFDAIDRSGFAVVSKAFVREVEAIVATFKEDEKAGYRSKDRQFAIDILDRVLCMKAAYAPAQRPADASALRLQAAADAMDFAVEEGGVEFLKAWLEDDVAHIRREWPTFDLSSLQVSKRR